MIHQMRLHDGPFKAIQNGSKTIEVRLNDEKRRLINIGDSIEFTNRFTQEKINVRVIGLHKYHNFKELYEHFDKISLGYRIEEIADYIDMEKYYSNLEQEKHGVVGIEICLIE